MQPDIKLRFAYGLEQQGIVSGQDVGVAIGELSWDISPAPLDEGLPHNLCECMAKSFCDYGKVCFVSDELGAANQSWLKAIQELLTTSNSEWFREIDHAHRIVRLPGVRLKPLALVETSAVRIAQSIFSIQALHYAPCQVVLFTSLGSPPLTIEDSVINDLITKNDWHTHVVLLRGLGVHTICTVMHDCTSLKLIFLYPSMLQRLAAALDEQTKVMGMKFIQAQV